MIPFKPYTVLNSLKIGELIILEKKIDITIDVCDQPIYEIWTLYLLYKFYVCDGLHVFEVWTLWIS